MKAVDFGLLKVQYEIFGESIEDLADQYDTTPRMIKYAAEQGNWQKLPISEALQDWRSIDDFDDIPPDLVDQVQSRLSVLNTVKSSALSPRYIAIEAAILGKVSAVLLALPTDDPTQVGALKVLSDIFLSLKSASLPGPQNGDGQGQSGITVQIMSEVTKDGDSRQGVQVSIADARPQVETGVSAHPSGVAVGDSGDSLVN